MTTEPYRQGLFNVYVQRKLRQQEKDMKAIAEAVMFLLETYVEKPEQATARIPK